MTTLQFDPTVYVSLALLFGISAQFTAMGGHDFLRGVVGFFESKVGIVYAVVVVAALSSPLILNDVVVIVLTPVIIRYAQQYEVDVAPMLVAEITAVNIASSLTPLGNPQNILLWMASGASFDNFVSGTWLPVLLSMVVASMVLLPLAMRAGGARETSSSFGSVVPAAYLLLVASATVVLDLVGMKPYVSLGVAFMVGFLFTYRSLRRLAGEFDYRSLLTLYVFIGAVTVASYLAAPLLASLTGPVAKGVQPYSAVFIGLVSNVISNVPATQLILNTVTVTSAMAPKIAVEAGFAGNIGPVASFANLLALQMARRAGLKVKRAVALQLLVGLLTYLPALL